MSMANYSAIADHDPMSASTESLRGRRRGRGKHDAGHHGNASWISSVINLANTILGAGLLAMPSALSKMGIFLGIFVIAWAGFTSGFGLYLQTRCARYVDRGHASFAALSQLTYPNASILFDAAIAVKCFGVAVSYLIIIGDLMPGVVVGFAPGAKDVAFLVDRQFWITAFMLIVIPLSFLRRLDSLKYTSIIALFSIAYLVILVVAHYIKGDTLAQRGPVRVFEWAGPINALAAFPVIVFAYTCHQNMFSILNEISDNSHFRTTTVILASIGGGCALYILTGITGYLSYGDNITGNIVSMYPTAAPATIGRFAIVVLVMFSYPLQIHPCRASIAACASWRPRRSPPRSPSPSLLPPSTPKAQEMSDLRFALVTTALIVASFLTAMTVSSLSLVLAYVGSTGSTTISFILPGLFYYKIADPQSAAHQRLVKDEDDAEDFGLGVEGGATREGVEGRERRRGLLRAAALGLALYGVVVMVTCLAINIGFGGGGH
ncbi:transmembrane amino acid transporter protein-domain-containing protein [Boeremia exigua]|uniref:transmembrane amino acid transporter protein-domain-containing protein n=1 Tax=Boeremia exigua TaxID=749465 RepID=UPI001E8CF345|nr:transmembrane amino acid transporter protein-domain-containing protein [Boeremia exigua]KAH6644203.1 transmembrane amino acid transporter protein-domain-containing protein [Boeremia exigua]